jgi:hypothetical protein
MQQVLDSILEVISVAEVCASRRAQLPALILSYSAMDAMSWLYAANPAATVRQRFTAWVERYALPTVTRLCCTSTELYAARCGLLHTFTADSDLSAKGVRKILYAWGSANLSDLERATEAVDATAWVAVHVSDLTTAVRLGIAQMFEDSQSDPVLAARIAQRGASYFEYADTNAFDFLKPGEPAV